MAGHSRERGRPRPQFERLEKYPLRGQGKRATLDGNVPVRIFRTAGRGG